MKNSKRNTLGKIAWGLYFIAAAGALIANAIYDFLGFWQLLMVAAFVPITVISVKYRQFGGLFIPLAIIGIVFATPLGITAITPWPLLGAALLLTVAFSFIIPSRWRSFSKSDCDFGVGGVVDDETSCRVNFGGSTKYFKTENLETAALQCNFGGIDAYMDGSTLSPNGATLHVDLNFGGIDLYVPKEWRVINDLSVSLGGVDEVGRSIATTDSPTLTLTGKVAFGGIDIHYV